MTRPDEASPVPPLRLLPALFLISALTGLGCVWEFIVPQFDQMFKEMGFRDCLPAATVLLIGSCRLLNHVPGLPLLPGLAMAVYYVRGRREFLRSRADVSEEADRMRRRRAAEARWISWSCLLLVLSLLVFTIVALFLPLEGVMSGAEM